MIQGTITNISGALVRAEGMDGARIYEVVRVAHLGLVGEIIEIRGNTASIQVYEETTGMKPGEPVVCTGEQLSVRLGPGLLGGIFDGIQRPLSSIAKEAGDMIARGVRVPALDPDRAWEFRPIAREGSEVGEGDVLGTVKETELIEHRVLVPPRMGKGRVRSIASGKLNADDQVCVLETEDGTVPVLLSQSWPIREPRPVRERLLPHAPLVTGQRVIDAFFPVAKGGTACVPGPFGAGKTVTLSQIAKWADADVIVYVGCGERGNEMTDSLIELQELKDPKTGRHLLERTVIIANTSNMPVAAREASIYTGVTIAEYFRDMGYSVALMADSTSRWAEALREMSARLEEMPGEEGYPAYLGSRVAAFYERAGEVRCLGSEERTGTLSIIGAVSPPGGDLSEPVTQNTLRVAKVFWGLEARLANARHFPSINWLSSYSLYLEDMEAAYKELAGPEFGRDRAEAMKILGEEARLEEIVRLVGLDALSDRDKLVWETARSLREDFLMQNAFDEVDTYTPLRKQAWMLARILAFYRSGLDMLAKGKGIEDVLGRSERGELSLLKEAAMEHVESSSV